MNGSSSSKERPSSPIARLRRRARWLIAGFSLLFGLVVLVWLLPGLLANSAMRDRMVRDALTGFDGQVTIGNVALGWFSPIAATDIAAVDGAGNPLADVKGVRSEKSLLSLLMDQSQPGTFHIDQPTVHVVVRNQGTNWEDALAEMLNQPSEPSSLDKIALQIHGGVLKARNDDVGRAWELENLEADLQYSISESSLTALRLTGQLTANGQAPGTIAVNLEGRPEATDGSGQVDIHVVSLPMGTFQSAARRLGYDVQVAGQLNCDAVVLWSEGGQRSTVQVNRLNIQSLAMTAPDFLGSDQLVAQSVTSQGTLERHDGLWSLQQFDLETDFAKCQLSGTVPESSLTSGALWSGGMAQLQQHDLQAFGQLDLPKLAAMLPTTLRIRPTTTLQNGEVKLAVATQREGERRMNAKLEIVDIAGVNSGQPFRLAKPIRLNADFRSTDAGLCVDDLTCQSSAVNLSARGTMAEGTATLRGKLTDLRGELGQFLDLSGIELGGDLDADVEWHTDANQQLAALGRAGLHNFRCSLGRGEDWREQELAITANATAVFNDGAVQQVKSATLTVDSASDRLSAELLRPVAAPLAEAVWPVHARAVGGLSTWQARLRPALAWLGVDLSQCKTTGTLDADATGTLSSRAIGADAVKVQLKDLKFDTDDVLAVVASAGAVSNSSANAGNGAGIPLHLNEKSVDFETRGLWDFQEGYLSSEATSLTSSTVALRAEQIVVQFSEKAPAINGKVAFNADLGRIRQATISPTTPATEFWTGGLSGQVVAARQANLVNFDLTADAKDLVYFVAKAAVPDRPAGWQEVWREPAVKLVGKQVYDQQADRLSVNQLSLRSAMANVQVSGSIDSAWAAPVAKLAGTADYDLQRVTEKLQRYTGDHVQLVGQQQGRFELNGPLFPPPASGGLPRLLVSPELTGNLQCGWQSASIDGLAVGPGQLNTQLRGGVVQAAPLDVPVSGGRLTTAPRIELNGLPVALYIDRGPMFQNVQISPEMCDRWMKYIAPMVADATRSQGSFSLSLDQARMPLATPHASDAAGNLVIQSAQVGPGPLAQKYIGLALEIRSILKGQPLSGGNALNQPWLTLPQQDVRFDVQNGRVRHQRLTVTVQDVVIHTTGSVGFDESLDLMAEVPVRDEWIASQPLLAGLKGTSIRIPLRGTFSRPDIDSRAIKELGQNLLRGAAEGLIRGNLDINRGLESLFGPRP